MTDTSTDTVVSRDARWAVVPTCIEFGEIARIIAVTALVSAALSRVMPLDSALTFALAGIAGTLRARTAAEAVGGALAGSVLTVLLLGGQVGQLPAPTVQVEPALFISAGIFGSLGGWLLGRLGRPRLLGWAIVAVIVGIFAYNVGSIVPDMSRALETQTAAEAYDHDTVFFVRVMQLQGGGADFYDSYGMAFAQDQRFDGPPTDLAGWRTPVLSTMWSWVFDDVRGVLVGFIAMACVAMAMAYHLAARITDEVSALVVPALLAAYYETAARIFAVTEYEFWAAALVLASATLLSFKRTNWALGFAVLAGLSREWLVSGLVAGATNLLVKRRWKAAIPWMVGLAVVVCAYLANMMAVRSYLESQSVASQLGAGGRLGEGGPGFLLYTVQYCAWLLANPTVVPYVAFVLGLMGASLRLLRRDFYTPLLALLPMVAFLLFGSGAAPGDPVGANDYYNAAYWPFLLVLVPVAWHAPTWRRVLSRPSPRGA